MILLIVVLLVSQNVFVLGFVTEALIVVETFLTLLMLIVGALELQLVDALLVTAFLLLFVAVLVTLLVVVLFSVVVVVVAPQLWFVLFKYKQNQTVHDYLH